MEEHFVVGMEYFLSREESFENKVELSIFLNAIFQFYNILVTKLTKEGDFAQGSRRNTFIFNF